MILVENDLDKQMGFYIKLLFQVVGLQTDSGNFRLYRDQDFYFFTHLINLQNFYVQEIENEFFELDFRRKQYWITYDTR